MVKKKGSMFFTLDVFLAAAILTMTILILFSFSSTIPVIQDTKVILDNTANVIINSKIQSLSIQAYTGPRTPEISNLKIHEKIALLIHENEEEQARSLIANVTNSIVPSEMGFIYEIDDIVIFNRTEHMDSFLVKNQLVYNSITLFSHENNNYGPNITRMIVWS